MLRWTFDVEHVDVILGNNGEYTGSMSRLPILVLECSKGGHLPRSISKFHLIMFRYSVVDDAMLDASTFGQDCISFACSRGFVN